MKTYYILSFISLLLLPLVISINYRQLSKTYSALTIVPVADLVETSTQKLFQNVKPQNIYDFLPLCGGYTPAPSFTCPRIHQLLFNEVVEVVQERGEEVLVRIPNAYHLYHNENSSNLIPNINHSMNKKNVPLNSFWTLKKNLLPLETTIVNKEDLHKIPPSMSFASKKTQFNNVITLAMPFTDPETNISYSAGTRFVKSCQQETESSFINAYIFNNATSSFGIIKIPQNLCIAQAHNPKDRIAQFVSLIKQWANLDSGYIPYVWGGSSFIHTSTSESQEVAICMNNIETSFFALPQYDFSPKPGLDCTGIINRAAQICGIPFYLRLSSSIATMLEELKPHEQLENGDIIWKPFHVFIVSDIEKNLIIESRGHGNGEGRVHEIALHKVFKGIHTYNDLVYAFHNKLTIYRLDKDGEILSDVPEFKLLKLASAWNIH